MAFFARTAGLVAQALLGLIEQPFQQLPPILQQRLAQAQFHRLQIAHPLAGKIRSHQPQEGFGFLEVRGLDFRRLKFFYRRIWLRPTGSFDR
jgi:hypothetical protein